MRKLVYVTAVAAVVAVVYGQNPPPAPAPAPFGGGFGRGGGGWMTSRGDAQRSAWIRTDAYLSPESVAKPGFGLEWKRKVDNTPRGANALTAGVAGNGSTLNPAPVILSGSGNRVFGLEVDTGELMWSRNFGAVSGSPTATCPGGLTAAVTRSTTAAQPAAGSVAGRSNGRGPYLGAVGKPGEGVPDDLMQGGMGGPGGPPGGGFPGGPGGPGGPGAPGRGPGGPNPFAGMGGGRGGPQAAYAIAADGSLHTLGLMEGKDVKKPVPFLAANANVSDTLAIGETVYAATSNGCAGVPNGVWAIDLSGAEPKVASWKAAGSVSGIAMDSKGTLLAAAGEAITALDPKTLEPKEHYAAAGAKLAGSPVVFTYQEREFIGSATADGKIALFAAGEKAALHVSAAVKGAGAALATWEDGAKNRFILLPTATGLQAYRVTGTGSAPKLEAAWNSADVASAPIVVNGVVFALKPGSASAGAVLYALDGVTGRALWNSAKTIASSVRSTPVWSSNAQVYVATQDGTVYAFGFAMDRHL